MLGMGSTHEAPPGAADPAPRVLVVDDEPMVRKLLRVGLARRGFAVTDVADGAAALESFGTGLYDIVLVDAMMPGMDGFATCRALRALPDGQFVPIVILTGLDDDASIGLAYESGATDFYVKSPQMTLLAERLRYLLRTAGMQRELARSRASLAKAQRIARLGSWEWDLVQRSIDASPEALQLLGVAGLQGPIPEATFVDLFYPPGVDAFRFEVLANLKMGRAHRLEGGVRQPDGTHALQVEIEAERDPRGGTVRVTGTVQDVTERRQAEERMRRLESFDGLTGLANRNLFRSRVEEALAAAGRAPWCIAVLVVGLDRFKRVNDSFGHVAGDALLREAAARLARSVRDSDTVARGRADLGRFAGDEFTVLLPRLAAGREAAVVAQRILDALRKPFNLDGNECWMTASIGVAAYPADGAGSERLIACAERAMRDAKVAGRDAFRFHETKRGAGNGSTMRTEAALRHALERGELRLHWQPIVDAQADRIVGAEVLMRWQRSERLVPPSEFIPVAEESGLILPMGDWALESACVQLAEWRRRGFAPIYVGVNLAASHVRKRDVKSQVRRVLDNCGLPPQALALEITETLLVDFAEPTLSALHSLRELGVKIAVDDFGTGYSSLSYLKHLPVTTLKIDRCFVDGIAADDDDAAIVSAVTGLAGSLSLDVVAEGVETEAQRRALGARGVRLMQGYLFGKALPVVEFERMLAHQGGSRCAA